MTEHEYLWAWIYYLGAASLFFAAAWLLSRRWWTEAKSLARLVLAAILYTPAYSDTSHGLLAPAWLTSISDMLLQRDGGFLRAGMPLLLVMALALLLSTLYLLWRWYQHRNRA